MLVGSLRALSQDRRLSSASSPPRFRYSRITIVESSAPYTSIARLLQVLTLNERLRRLVVDPINPAAMVPALA